MPCPRISCTLEQTADHWVPKEKRSNHQKVPPKLLWPSRAFQSSQQVYFLIGQLGCNPLAIHTESHCCCCQQKGDYVKEADVPEALLFLRQSSKDTFRQNLSKTPAAAPRIRECERWTLMG